MKATLMGVGFKLSLYKSRLGLSQLLMTTNDDGGRGL
jgi:hypothetical protein